jgi:hypothetical protein
VSGSAIENEVTAPFTLGCSHINGDIRFDASVNRATKHHAGPPRRGTLLRDQAQEKG